MNELFAQQTFIYVTLFLLPGFIARWVWSAIIVAREGTEKASLLASLVASAWLYAPLSPLIYWELWVKKVQDTSPKWFALSLFLVIFAWPVIAGLALATIRKSQQWRKVANRLDLRSPEPRAWDTFFGRREGCFVRVTFVDGSMIGGLYYGPDSAASVYPVSEDLLLEVLYRLDDEGKFCAPIPRSKGGWIDMKNVRHLEFFTIENENREETINVRKEASVDIPTSGSEEEPSAGTVGPRH